MQIEQFNYYRAKINYHRTDDFREGIKLIPNGTEVKVSPLWVYDEGRFAGTWYFDIVGQSYGLPQIDLILIEDITAQEYEKIRKEIGVEYPKDEFIRNPLLEKENVFCPKTEWDKKGRSEHPNNNNSVDKVHIWDGKQFEILPRTKPEDINEPVFLIKK